MIIMRRDPAPLGGALMIRPEPNSAGRSPDIYHEEGPSSAGRSPDDSHHGSRDIYHEEGPSSAGRSPDDSHHSQSPPLNDILKTL